MSQSESLEIKLDFSVDHQPYNSFDKPKQTKIILGQKASHRLAFR